MSSAIAELKRLTKNEPIAEFLGMKLEKLSPGYSRVSMHLKLEYLNFNGIVFGGIIMALADQAFAYASNSLVRPNIASQFNIHLLAAPKAGTKLIAEGRVLKQGKRAGVTEITITDEAGAAIAKATGTTIPIAEAPESSKAKSRRL
ncbi:MAG: PaaI family thioesterase [Chloroflexota bacterium]